MFEKILANTRRLSVSIHLDRVRYFTEQSAVVTLTVTNPTSETLEVLEPFQKSTGELDFSVHCLNPAARNRPACFVGKEDYYAPLRPKESPIGGDGGRPWNLELPTRIIHPTERMAINFEIPSQVCADSKLMADCRCPFTEDKYELDYHYESWAKAKFSVVEPNIEALSVVLLPTQRETRTSRGERQMVDRKVLVLALEYDGHHVIAVAIKTLEDQNTPQDRLDEERLFTYKKIEESNSRRYGPYRLIAEMDKAIQSLAVEPDKDDNLLIHCRDTSGDLHIFKVDAARRVLVP